MCEFEWDRVRLELNSEAFFVTDGHFKKQFNVSLLTEVLNFTNCMLILTNSERSPLKVISRDKNAKHPPLSCVLPPSR